MKRNRHRRLSVLLLLLVVGAVILSLAGSPAVQAQGPPPPSAGRPEGSSSEAPAPSSEADPPDPGNDGGPGDPDAGDDDNGDRPGPVQRIIQSISHVMTFPIETMTAALTKAITEIMGGAVEKAALPFVSALGAIVLGDVAHGPSLEIYGPAWSLIRNISIALWPLTLALVVVWAAQGGLTDNPITFANLKGGLLEWGLSVVLSIASLFLIGLGLRLSRSVTTMILTDLWGTVDMQTIVGVFFNIGLWTALIGLAPGVAILFGLLMLTFGFSICTALAFAYVARYALLLILISLAPLTITLGVIPQLRWLYYLWFKGLIMAFLLGPINALLLKMAQMAALSGLGEVPGLFGGLVKFLAAAGILSILLSINYAIIRGVFGAVAELATKFKKGVQGVVTGLIAIGATIATGGIAGAGLAGAGLAGGAAGGLGGILGGGGGGAAAGAAGAGAAGAGAGVAGSSAAAGVGAAAAGAGAKSAAGAGAAGAGAKGAAGASGGSSASGGAASGAGATKAALDDPGFLNRMGSMLQTAGQSGMASQNPVARAAAGAARGVGSALTDRGRRIERGMDDDSSAAQGQAATRTGTRGLASARTEAQARAQHGGWAGLLQGHGISRDQEGFSSMEQSLSQLADRYGGDEVRKAAPDILPALSSAQQHGGISLQQHAESAGYDNPGDLVGGEIEQRIWGHRERPEQPSFPHGSSMKPDSWQGSGPSAYDYRRGTRLAGSLGRHNTGQIDGYARLSWAVRDPSRGGGPDAVDALDQAAGQARYAARNTQGQGRFAQTAWPRFAEEANKVTDSLGLDPSDLPSSWLAERQFLSKGEHE